LPKPYDSPFVPYLVEIIQVLINRRGIRRNHFSQDEVRVLNCLEEDFIDDVALVRIVGQDVGEMGKRLFNSPCWNRGLPCPPSRVSGGKNENCLFQRPIRRFPFPALLKSWPG